MEERKRKKLDPQLTAREQGLELDYLIFLILLYSGIMVRELVALKWKDVAFKSHTICITKTYYNPTNNTLEYQLVTPKSRKSRRKIIVDEEVINALKEHKKVQKEVIEWLGDVTLTKTLYIRK